MVKDRLSELQNKLVDEKGEKATEEKRSKVGSLIKNKYQVIEMSKKQHSNKDLRIFLNKCDVETKKLIELRTAVSSLEVVHADINACANINDKDLTDKKHKITADIRRLTHEIHDAIRSLKHDIANFPKADSDSASSRIAALHLQKLSSDLNEVTTLCQSERARFDEKVKARLRKEYEIIGEQKTDDELNELIEKENFRSFTQEVDEMNEARRMLDETKQRQFEMTNLEKSVREVRELFIDINMLVEEQGEMLNTIEANVVSARVDVEKGDEKLKKANELQKKARRKKICILVIVLLVVLIITAIIVIIVVNN